MSESDQERRRRGDDFQHASLTDARQQWFAALAAGTARAAEPPRAQPRPERRWAAVPSAAKVGAVLAAVVVLVLVAAFLVRLRRDEPARTPAAPQVSAPAQTSVTSGEEVTVATPPPVFDPGRFTIIAPETVGRWEVATHREDGPGGTIFLNNIYVKTLELSADGRYCTIVRDGARECGTYSFIAPNRIRFETPPPTGEDIYEIDVAADALTLRAPQRLTVTLRRVSP